MRCAFARRLQAGQALAHDHRQRLLDRRVGARRRHRRSGRDGSGRRAWRRDWLATPSMRRDADRLDARLLDRVEDRAGARDLRRQAAMHLGIVAGEPQRHRIGVAAQDRGLARVEPARRLGQPRLGAARSGSGSGARAHRRPRGRALLASARRQPATARLNGSCGPSTFDGGLVFEPVKAAFGLIVI